MREPSIPNYTCPAINKCIAMLEETVSDRIDEVLQYRISNIEEALESASSHLVEDIKDLFENIRSENEDLRSCAEYYKEKKEELEREIDELEDKLVACEARA